MHTAMAIPYSTKKFLMKYFDEWLAISLSSPMKPTINLLSCMSHLSKFFPAKLLHYTVYSHTGP